MQTMVVPWGTSKGAARPEGTWSSASGADRLSSSEKEGPGSDPGANQGRGRSLTGGEPTTSSSTPTAPFDAPGLGARDWLAQGIFDGPNRWGLGRLEVGRALCCCQSTRTCSILARRRSPICGRRARISSAASPSLLTVHCQYGL